MDEGIKVYFIDENELIDYYCNEIAQCSHCNGTNQNGDPNGYGCEAQEEFLEYHENWLIENSNKKRFVEVEYLLKEMSNIMNVRNNENEIRRLMVRLINDIKLKNTKKNFI